MGKYSNSLVVVAGILFIWSIIVTACNNSIPGKGYLTDTPCAVPCWQGIIPDLATRSDVFSIISDRHTVEQSSIITYTQRSDPSISSYRFEMKSGEIGRVEMHDGIVYRIDVMPGQGPSTTFNEIIGHFGPPSGVFVDENSSETIGCYDVDLFYPEKGLWVTGGGCHSDRDPKFVIHHHSPPAPSEAYVFPEIYVKLLAFFQPGQNLRQVLAGKLLYDPIYAQHFDDYDSVWHGYGFYPIAPPFPIEIK